MAMSVNVKTGTIVFREWNTTAGLSESLATFETLDELFAICINVDDPHMVDRIVLSGSDEDGHPRTVTFRFQSVTKG